MHKLENTCRWLQVIASSRTILTEDLPPELRDSDEPSGGSDWEGSLARWANQFLEHPHISPLLDTAVPKFERIMIDAALRKQA